MSENVVNKDFCEERHRAVKDRDDVQDNRLDNYSNRLGTVEDAVIRLTLLIEQSKRRDVFDKILTICVFVTCLILAAIVLGPEVTRKMIGGIR